MKLFVKLDHVAGLRTAGGGREPEPAVAAALAELEGVGGITMHLHSDRSNVQLRDIQVLKETLSVPLNLELAPTMKNREHAFDLRPQSVTLVQEPKDVRADRWPLDEEDKEAVSGFISAMKEAELVTALLIKPTIDSVRWAHRLGAQVIRLDTIPFSQSKTEHEHQIQLDRLTDCVRLGNKLGMLVNAGGGIDYRNILDIANLKLNAVHVGHSVVARAVQVGIQKAVADMITAMEKGRR